MHQRVETGIIRQILSAFAGVRGIVLLCPTCHRRRTSMAHAHMHALTLEHTVPSCLHPRPSSAPATVYHQPRDHTRPHGLSTPILAFARCSPLLLRNNPPPPAPKRSHTLTPRTQTHSLPAPKHTHTLTFVLCTTVLSLVIRYDQHCFTSSDGRTKLCSCADAVNSTSIWLRPGSNSDRFMSKSQVTIPYIYYTTPRDRCVVASLTVLANENPMLTVRNSD
jgi:hypothetical protein